MPTPLSFHGTMRPAACLSAKAGGLLIAAVCFVGCTDGGASTITGATGSGDGAGGGAQGGSAGGLGLGGLGGTAGQGVGGESAGSGGVGLGGSGASGGRDGSAGSAAAGGVGGATSDVLEQLRQYLAIARAERPALSTETFAVIPLTSGEAEQATDLLWNDYAQLIRDTRQAESEARSITLDDATLRYHFTVYGEAPAEGHSLFLSLHGGGEAEASVNDQQWENQKLLYQPDEGIYLAPRAPTNTWNLWHQEHIDALFDRLITNLIVLEKVNPNRVYVMGYSAGGDGVYQLGPRMADYWAAAAMMAGHPNDAKPDSLRNIGFTIHVGGLDTAFDRNLVAAEWGGFLSDLQAADPEGYAHDVEVHPDKPHWMDLEDAVAVPWMANFTRNPVPDRVVWLQDDVVHDRFYWLAVESGDAMVGARIEASYANQELSIDGTGVSTVWIRLSDAMMDLDEAITIRSGGTTLYEGPVERTILTLHDTLEERGDPALIFSAEVAVELP